MLFESSGMYNGEDVPWLISHLLGGRLDAVWGSRRLSVRDIEESYRLKYRQHAVMGSVSRIGSHVLSLAYLLLYGRYVSDTLSGARVVRAGRCGAGAGGRWSTSRPISTCCPALLRPQGRDVRSAGSFLFAVTRAGPPHDVCRRRGGRRHDRVAPIRSRAADAPRPGTSPPIRRRR